MKNNYISIEEFTNMYNIKASTVKRRKDDIPGLKYENGEFYILEGTRYPSRDNYKLENAADRRYVLLKAISEYRYIDHVKLKLYKQQFDDMLKELLSAGLIKENKLYNKYGANGYDCTIAGEKVLDLKKDVAIKKIVELVAVGVGKAIGSALSEK
ncbi:MAG: hypothetical protein CSB16_02580 [Clostridiales bacterium]|nr:MAG: hypothetical protein CSB16_02580 [Clostridiales bacterium]